MDVHHTRERVRERSKLQTLTDLLQVSLAKKSLVCFTGKRSLKNALRPVFNSFLLNSQRLLLALASGQLQNVGPIVRVLVNRDFHRNNDVAVVTRMKTSKVLEPPALLHGPHEAAARSCDVTKKSKRIEEIAFTGCIWTDDERPLSERRIDLLKVAPVRENQFLN